MFIHLKDSSFRISNVAAITKGSIAPTNYTPEYFTMCVYLIGCTQPIVHTYEQETERDEVFNEVRNYLDETK